MTWEGFFMCIQTVLSAVVAYYAWKNNQTKK